MTTAVTNTTIYVEFLKSIKSRIRDARITAARAVNKELTALYWSIGKDIVEKQKQQQLVAEIPWGQNLVIMEKPVGVAEYRLTTKLPRALTGKLPDPKKLKQEILREIKEGKTGLTCGRRAGRGDLKPATKEGSSGRWLEILSEDRDE